MTLYYVRHVYQCSESYWSRRNPFTSLGDAILEASGVSRRSLGPMSEIHKFNNTGSCLVGYVPAGSEVFVSAGDARRKRKKAKTAKRKQASSRKSSRTKLKGKK